MSLTSRLLMSEGFWAIQRVTNQSNDEVNRPELACCNDSCDWLLIIWDLQQEQNSKSSDDRCYMTNMFVIMRPVQIMCEPLIFSYYSTPSVVNLRAMCQVWSTQLSSFVCVPKSSLWFSMLNSKRARYENVALALMTAVIKCATSYSFIVT